MSKARSHDYNVNRVIRAADLSPWAKLMLGAIYDHAGPNGTGKCWASGENLAKECNIPGNTKNHGRRARTLIDELKDARWITVVPRGNSKHARVRDIYIGPKLWESLGLGSPSGDDSDQDSGVLELGPGSPSTRTGESSHQDSGVLPTSPRTSSMNGTSNVGHSVPSGKDGMTDRREGAPKGKDAKNAWRQVWDALIPPPTESWTWLQEDRDVAESLVFKLVHDQTAVFLKPLVDVIREKPGMLTAGGVSWKSIAAAIVVASGRDPDGIGVLPYYVNGVAKEFEAGREIDAYTDWLIKERRFITSTTRDVDKEFWQRAALQQALEVHFPAIAAAMEAIVDLEEAVIMRPRMARVEYHPVRGFMDRIRDLSLVFSDADWDRLAVVARGFIEGNESPTFDELLSRAEGEGDGDVLKVVG